MALEEWPLCQISGIHSAGNLPTDLQDPQCSALAWQCATVGGDQKEEGTHPLRPCTLRIPGSMICGESAFRWDCTHVCISPQDQEIHR